MIRKLGFFAISWLFIVFSLNCAHAETINYSYDSMLRVTRAQYGDGTVVDYVYDNLGNRLQKSTTPSGSPANTAPSPPTLNIPDGQTEVSPTTGISWSSQDIDPEDKVVYYLYLGTQSPPPLFASGWQTTFTGLRSMTTYYWRVVSRDSHNVESSSPVYSFTTKNDPPVASFEVTQASGLAPLFVQFTDTSTSLDDEIVSWAWDFNNDGITDSTEKDPSYTYSTPGVYSVKLLVTDIYGASDEKVRSNFITVGTDNDNDAIFDSIDNCPTVANYNQSDLDQDNRGDLCDPDLDGDGIDNTTDNCVSTVNPDQKNSSGETYGDECIALHCVNTSAELQSALNEASSDGHDNIIRLVQGTYKKSQNDSQSFFYDSSESQAIEIRGGYNSDCSIQISSDPLKTVLDGEDIGTLNGSGILTLFNNGTTSAETITIQNLSLINGNEPSYDGGAIFIYNMAGKVKLTNNIFVGNRAAVDGGGVKIYTETGEIILTNNSVTDNSADYGSGISLYTEFTAKISLVNNIIKNNTADNSAGGVYIYGSQNNFPITLINNIIAKNSASDGSGGGAMVYSAGKIDLINNTITGNSALGDWADGGGLYVYAYEVSPLNIFNNVIWGNTANTGDDLYIGSNSSAQAYNNDFDPTKVYGTFVEQGQNINTDPLFSDASNDDFHLSETSPCLHTGNNIYADGISSDFEDDQRIIGGTIDIGADEYLGGSAVILTMATNPQNGGITSPPIGIKAIAPDSPRKITVKTNPGFVFRNWQTSADSAVVADPGAPSTTVTLSGSSTVTATFSLMGDLDGNGKLSIADAIVGLRILTDYSSLAAIDPYTDVNGNKKIGIEEVIYIMNYLTKAP